MDKIIEKDCIKYVLNYKEKTAAVVEGYIDLVDSFFIHRSIKFNGNEYIVTSILEDAFVRGNAFTIQLAPNSEIRTIGERSFSGNGIESFTIPPHLIKICDDAFAGCRYLKNVEIPSNSELLSIGKNAFFYTKIESFTFPPHLTEIGEKAFSMCLQLKNVEIPKNSEIRIIGKYAFYDCGIQKFTIPPHLTVLEENVFDYCKQLESIEFTENSELRTIENFAFNSSPIECISFPPNLKELKPKWAIGANKIRKICIMEGNPVFSMYDDKLLLRKSSPEKENFDVLVYAICSIEKLVIPNFIEIIGTHSLYQCEHLKQIEIPNDSKLRIIEEHAFDLTLIDNFIIPSSLEKVENCWFPLKMSKITIMPDNKFFTLYNDKMILGKSSLEKENFDTLVFSFPDIEKVKIPSSIEIINSNIFTNCMKFEHVEFESNSKIRIIKQYAFSKSMIHQIKFPPSLTKIENKSFCMCKKLIKIEFSMNSNLEIIDEAAFLGTSIDSVVFPSKLTYIGKEAFKYCINLQRVVFPNDSQIKSIEQNSFVETKIEIIEIPKSVKTIKKWSFVNCRSLKRLLFPFDSQLQSIEKEAFVNTAIESISFPPSIKFIDLSAFRLCKKIQIIEFEENIELKNIEHGIMSQLINVLIVIPVKTG